MSDGSKIEWTAASWNPIVGCSIVSPGCTNCYAMRVAGARTVHTAKYAGLTQPSKAGPVWTGEVRFWEKALLDPLKWREPRRVFVNSMGDLFHESIPDEWIDRVFAVMALAPHQFQALTKRPERMRKYLSGAPWGQIEEQAARIAGRYPGATPAKAAMLADLAVQRVPLPNVWLGVSAERQQEADERIPLLLETPAAVRFVSLEPLLGPINLRNLTLNSGLAYNALRHGEIGRGSEVLSWRPLDWVIVGGESGRSARPMHLSWVRSIVDQCRAAGVACFVKQMGAQPVDDLGYTEIAHDIRLADRKGGDWSKWPESMRVREFPETRP